MDRKFIFGRLDYDARADAWEIITPDGSCPLRAGDRVSLGNVGGIPIYAVLIRDGMNWAWTMSPVPTSPEDGMRVSIWAAAPEDSDT